MRKFILFLFSFFIGFGLFVWVGKTIGWQEVKNAFLVFTGWQGLVIFGLTLLTALIGTLKWQEILKGEGVSVSFKKLLGPYLAGFSLMFLIPIVLLGGEIFRGYVLKEKDSVVWSKGMASVIIDRILEWTANLTVILFGILLFLYNIGLPPKNLILVFGGVFLVFAAATAFFYFKVSKKESIVKFCLKMLGLKILNEQNTFLEIEKVIFGFFRARKKSMWNAFSLSFLRAGVMWIRTWLLIMFLGKGIGWLPALSILGFSYLAVMIPIPTALGSHEAIQVFSFSSLGLAASSATAFTMIIRGAELILSLIGVVILFRLGSGLLKNALFKKIDNLIE